jgi:hypothetical protein
MKNNSPMRVLLVVACAICAVIVGMCLYVDRTDRILRESFATWLGPQHPTESLFGRTDFIRDHTQHPVFARHDITLHIVSGDKVRYGQSRNAVVSYDGQRVTQASQMSGLVPTCRYLVGTTKLRKGELGNRFLVLDLKIRSGPLMGAIVHLRGDKYQESIIDKCVCIYRIPASHRVDEGPVAFNICAWAAK